MKKLMSFLTTIFLIGLLYYIATNYNELTRMFMVNILYKDTNLVKENNSYTRDYKFNYVSSTDNFYVKSKQDILNVYYTALNGGYSDLTFYCDLSYENCINDLNELISDAESLSIVNNFVPTYNIYSKVYFNINTLGRIHVDFQKVYDDEMIKFINEKIDSIYSSIITDNMSTKEKIKAAHDYIINHTKYDTTHAESVKNGSSNNYHISNTAYGVFANGYAICGGYTDAMALFLDKIGVINYKISSDSHIWNLVNLDGIWYHLDLTWDDPVTNDGKNRLEDNFFLISTEELEKIDTGYHIFNKIIYSEAK